MKNVWLQAVEMKRRYPLNAVASSGVFIVVGYYWEHGGFHVRLKVLVQAITFMELMTQRIVAEIDAKVWETIRNITCPKE